MGKTLTNIVIAGAAAAAATSIFAVGASWISVDYIIKHFNLRDQPRMEALNNAYSYIIKTDKRIYRILRSGSRAACRDFLDEEVLRRYATPPEEDRAYSV